MKIRNITAASVVGLVLLANSIVPAAAQEERRDIKASLEECALGVLFDDEDDRTISIIANVFLGFWTQAITSGTVTPDLFCKEKTVKSAQFIYENYQRLAEDVTRGEGEFLLTAMNILDCNTIAQQSAVTSDLRKGLAIELVRSDYNDLDRLQKSVNITETIIVSSVKNCAV